MDKDSPPGDIGHAGWYHRANTLSPKHVKFKDVANVSRSIILLKKLDGTSEDRENQVAISRAGNTSEIHQRRRGHRRFTKI